MNTVHRQFFGRQRSVNEIAAGLRAHPPVSYSVVGSKLIGKSRLLHHLASDAGPLTAHNKGNGPTLAVYLDCAAPETQRNLAEAASAALVEQLQVGHFARDPEGHIGRHVQNSQDNQDRQNGQNATEGSTLDALTSVQRRLKAEGIHPVALLDNVDALPGSSEPAPVMNALAQLLQQMPAVVSSEQPLSDATRDLADARLFDGMTQVFVGLLDQAAAMRWLDGYAKDWPALQPVSGDLAAMTGLHPYLLDRLGDALDDAQARLAPDQMLGSQHLPLIRMRLAEHGRPLFVSLWQTLQTPPSRVNVRALLPLLALILQGPLPIQNTVDSQTAEINWLINQAIVVYGTEGYQIACPLLAEFLSQRMGAQENGRVRSLGATHADSPFLRSLTKTENALLRYFQANANVVISPEELLADVWNRPDASARRVQEAIRRLRLRLDEAVPPVGVIHNERGRGYRFVPAQT